MKKSYLIIEAIVVAIVVGVGVYFALRSNGTQSEASAESESEVTSEEFDKQVQERIEDFYREYVFGTEELTTHVVETYCTPRLVKVLADAYDYDGEGYAVWMFRSDAQDGPSDVSLVESVQRVEPGKYEVKYIDMGIEGSLYINVVTEDGVVLFDAIDKE